MQCEEVRDQLLVMVTGGGRVPPQDPVARHLDTCEACRHELESLGKTWALLGRWPEASPGPTIGDRLARRVRWLGVRVAVLTVRGWTPAVLSAAIGVGLSLALSFLVHYSDLVRFCREALRTSDFSSVPFLVAGIAYGLPVAIGSIVIMRHSRSGLLIKSLETSLLFLLIIGPYVIAQCREFPPLLQAALLLGMGAGALLPTVGGLWVVGRFLGFQPEV